MIITGHTECSIGTGPVKARKLTDELLSIDCRTRNGRDSIKKRHTFHRATNGRKFRRVNITYVLKGRGTKKKNEVVVEPTGG